jgi:hypothetical protein
MRRGGAFLSQGADTCVYSPQVACVPGTQTPEVLPPGDYISRVVNKKTEDGQEVVNQVAVKAAIHRIQEKYPDKEIEKFFNVAVATCTPLFKDSDILSIPSFAGDVPKNCRANDNQIKDAGPYPEKVNFITLRQNEDVGRSKRPKIEILAQLRKLFHAVAYLNNENVIHTDAHFNNIAWMGDHIVMHDWGRAAVGIKGFKKFIERWELRNQAARESYSFYPQFKGPCDIMETCPIKLNDDSTSHRFMKFYDVASLAAGAQRQRLIISVVVKTFGTTMATLWKDKTIPTNQMMDKIHQAIDVMFDTNVPSATIPATLVAPPVPEPVPEVSQNSSVQLWEDWIGSNKWKKVSLRLRDKPGETKIIARVFKTHGQWALFEIDAATEEKLIAAKYPIAPAVPQGRASMITFIGTESGGYELYIPISFLGHKVILEDAPLSEYSLSPDPYPIAVPGGARKLNQTQRFCKCIKKVRKTVKNEKGPIAICVNSVLQTRGRTLKRFTCGRKGRVITQKAKH